MAIYPETELKIAGNSGNYCQCQVPRKTEEGGRRKKSPVRRLPIPPRPEAGAHSAEPSPTRHSPRTNPAPHDLCGSALSLSGAAAALQETAGTARRSRSEPHVFVLRLDNTLLAQLASSPHPSPRALHGRMRCGPCPDPHHLVLSSHPALSRREAAPVS